MLRDKLRMVLYGNTPYMDRLALCLCRLRPDYLEILRYQEAANGRKVNTDILLREEDTDDEAGFVERDVEISLTRIRLGEENPKEHLIFRYQKGQEILRNIFQIYQKYGTELPCIQYGAGLLDMTLLFSLSGSDHQLPVLAYALAKGRQQKTLYMNLSCFSGMAGLLEETVGETVSDLMYGVRQCPDKFPIILQSVLHQREHLDYIHPPENPSDLFEIGNQDMQKMLQLLSRQTDYRQVVWACNGWNPLVWQLLQQCRRIYFLSGKGGDLSLQEVRQFIEKEVCASFQDKVSFVTVPAKRTSALGDALWEDLQQGEWAGLAEQWDSLADQKEKEKEKSQ